MWQQDFGGSRDVLGKPFRFGLNRFTIAAVAPRGFRGIGSTPADVWLPLGARAGRLWRRLESARGGFSK